MPQNPLDYLPLPIFFVVAIACAIASIEVGFRMGTWRRAHAEGEKEAPTGAMVAAILGLLAFMLAFTFGMAASRFDARRMTVLDEANAVGTTYLRAQLLPDPERLEVAKLLREYVEVRIQAIEERKVAEGIVRSESLHDEIWRLASSAAKKDNHSVMTGIFIQSLNEMIDLHSRRVLLGVRSRVPLVIWIGLFSLAAIGMASMGYQAGLSGTRRSPAMLFLATSFAGIMYLIVDLDRPFEGILNVGQQTLIDLQNSMQRSEHVTP